MIAIHHWPLHHLNIKNAFLPCTLQVEVYMYQPLGFIAFGDSCLVCKFYLFLYGLNQSSWAWFGRFRSALTQFVMVYSCFCAQAKIVILGFL